MIHPEHALQGVYEHKLDPKCRVSVPADWRHVTGGSQLWLLQSTSYELPALRVLTESEILNMLKDVEGNEKWTVAQKKQMRGRLHARCLMTTLNPQGKLLIPKAWCKKPEIEASGQAMLVGRGSYFEIFNLSNYDEMCRREEEATASLNTDVDFF